MSSRIYKKCNPTSNYIILSYKMSSEANKMLSKTKKRTEIATNSPKIAPSPQKTAPPHRV